MLNLFGGGELPMHKCLLVGDACTGKTSFLRRHLTGKFEQHYEPTIGVSVHPITFYTDHGTVKLDIWDIAGQAQLNGLRNGYYFFAHCAIIMFDLGSIESCRHVRKWRHDIQQICGNAIPIVVCGNKVDINKRAIPTDALHYHLKDNFDYFEISTRANYNIELPFIWLCSKILKCKNLKLLSQPNLNEPDIQIDKSKRKKMHKDLKALKQRAVQEDALLVDNSDGNGKMFYFL